MRKWLGMLIVAMFALLAFGTTGSMAQEAGKTETVQVLHYVTHEVQKRGEHLWGLAGQYGVSMQAILDANPAVAKRTAKHTECGPTHGLCLGERLTIPVYVAEEKTVNNVGDDALVAIPMGEIRAKDAQLAALTNENTKLNKTIKFMIEGGLIAAGFLIFVWLIAWAWRRAGEEHAPDSKIKIKNGEHVGSGCHESTPQTLFEREARKASAPRDAREKTMVATGGPLAELKGMTGEEISAFFEKTALVIREGKRENPVLVRNLHDFIKKHPEFNGKTLAEMEKALSSSSAVCCSGGGASETL